MRYFIGLAASFVFFTLATNVKALPIVIDFDDLTLGTIVDTQFDSLGVTFSNASAGFVGIAPGGSSPIGLVSVSSGPAPQPSNPIVATFDQAVSSVSLTGAVVGSSGFILSAFDAISGGNLLATSQIFGVTASGSGEFFTLTVANANIFRVDFSQALASAADTVIVFDNFAFESTTVPEPSTLAALGIGLFTISAIARRRRKI